MDSSITNFHREPSLLTNQNKTGRTKVNTTGHLERKIENSR